MENNKNTDETFFTLAEIKKIVKDIPNAKFQKRALAILGEALEDVAYSILKIAIDLTPQGQELTKDILVRAAKRYASLKIPMIHYLWIINSNGTALFSQSYSGLNFPDTIFSGLLVGIVNMIKEVSGRDLETIVLGDLSIYIQEINPIICAVIADESKGIPALVREIGKEFLKIYGHRIGEPTIDVNVFSNFGNAARRIIREWGIVKLPTDAAGDSVAKLLDEELIRHGVITAAQRKDLQSALKELKSIPIFHEEHKSSFEEMISKSFSTEKPSFVKSDKSGKELIQEIFSAVNKLKSSASEEEANEEE